MVKLLVGKDGFSEAMLGKDNTVPLSCIHHTAVFGVFSSGDWASKLCFFVVQTQV